MFLLAELSVEQFLKALAALRAEIAGYLAGRIAFEVGYESLIAKDRLDGSGDPIASAVNRSVFYDALVDATHSLQVTCQAALAATASECESHCG